jgi:hypothetical protein
MDRNNILENIRKQFRQLFSSYETTPVSTADGKNLLIMGSGLEIGYTLVEVNEDNTQTPLADGEYNLSDGTKVGVTGGLISAIMAPEPAKEGETSPMDVATIEMEEMPMDVEEVIDPEMADGYEDKRMDMEKRISELESQLQEVMKMLSETMGSCGMLKETQVQMSNQLKSISNEPAGSSISVKKMVQDKATKNITTLDEIREIQKKMNKG